MTPWRWWAGDPEDICYDLAQDCETKEEAIQLASAQLKPGEQFRIVEARASENKRYEGSEFVPFLRMRNEELITVGAADETQGDQE